MAQAQSSAPEGSLVFESYCAECHGSRGSGTTEQPAIIGEATLARFANALELHQYLDAHMPKIGKSELSAPDYWAVLSFIVVANGGRLPDGGLNEANAGSVKLHAQ